MLESIVISNFAIIDHASIEFDQGMTALTGETGAGKSILLDAIQLVLGDRADNNCVKAGTDKADISVSFNLTKLQKAKDWLQEFELNHGSEENDVECLLRRVVQSNGRSKAFINGTPVPLNQLKSLGEMLVDIHGQHEHQSLQKYIVQQQLLDHSLADKSVLNEVAALYQKWVVLKKNHQQAIDQSTQKQQRIDLLRMYTQELQELDLKEGEIKTLQEEYARLSHSGHILETTATLVDRLYENDEQSIQLQMAECVSAIEQLTLIDESLQNTTDILKSAWIQIQEASADLRTYHDNIDLDPKRLDWLNSRLSQAQTLAKKHQTSPDELFNLASSMQLELDQLMFTEADIQQLEKEMQQSAQEYLNKAIELSQQRKVTAKVLSAEITEVMQTLGMQGGQFDITVSPLKQESSYTRKGIDQIEFLVSANPGQPLRPIGKVASGGELSRISLAIQVILSESSQIPTLIFDEVDSGIGGGIAEIVGRKLREIGKHRQVFCVTHLPQVATQAHQHYLVNKSKSSDATTTEILILSPQQRQEEIARMLGGLTITEQSRAHAQQMIDAVY